MNIIPSISINKKNKGPTLYINNSEHSTYSLHIVYYKRLDYVSRLSVPKNTIWVNLIN